MLTGLGNRRALARELACLLPDADDAQPIVLVLFDLDGFKHYNDTFGHPAGDALLVRLGANLATYLSGRGRAFRMGGDEFCALFEPGDEVADPIIAGAASALTEHGEGFNDHAPPTARSCCRARRRTPPRRCGSPTSACTRRSTRAGRRPTRQSKDVLLRALTERDPDLFGHIEGVGGSRRGDRAPPGHERRRGGVRAARRRAARRRQGRDPGRDPDQARAAGSATSGSSSAATR